MAAGAPGAVDGTTPSAAALNTGLAVGKQGSSAEGVDTASNGGGLDHTIGRTDAGNDHEASGIQAAATESTLSSSVPEQGASESSLKGNGACADDSGIRSGGRGGRGRGGGGGRGRGRGKGRGRGRGRRNAERPQDAEREEYVPLEAERWPGVSYLRLSLGECLIASERGGEACDMDGRDKRCPEFEIRATASLVFGSRCVVA